MTLSATIFQTLDGVVQSPGAPDEDRSGGFDRGGWLAPYADADMGAAITSVFERSGAFLLGRRTYDIFAGYWPGAPREGDIVAQRLNDLPRYVVSSTLRRPAWEGTTVVGNSGENAAGIAAAIAELKERTADAGELQVHGSPTLVAWLVARGLLDELNLLTYPVVLGGGRRLFAEGAAPTALELADSRVTRAGVVVATYHPVGEPEFRAVDA